MAKKAELLKELSENIEKIRELGISYGLSDDQIDYCIEKVIESPEKVTKRKEKARKPRSLCRSICLWYIRIWGVLFALWFGLSILTTVSPTVDRILGQSTAPLMYPMLRALRLITLPLARNYDLTMYYDAQCVIPNPWYEEEPPDCNACSVTESLLVLENVTTESFKKEFLEHWQFRPLIVKGGNPSDVTYNDVRSAYIQNKLKLASIQGRLEIWDHSLKTPEELFMSIEENHVLSEKDFHARWIVKNTVAAQVVGSVFPWADFLPKKREFNTEKTVFIENSRSPSYSMPRGALLPYAWYVQGSGSREIVFKPHKNCMDKCEEFRYVVQPTDMVFYMEHFWFADSNPVPDEANQAPDQDISVSFLGSFSM